LVRNFSTDSQRSSSSQGRDCLNSKKDFVVVMVVVKK
jgi:hypothetical protein